MKPNAGAENHGGAARQAASTTGKSSGLAEESLDPMSGRVDGETDSAEKGNPNCAATAASMDEFVRLLSANQQRVFLYLTSLVARQRDVDDLFQETSMVCWREFASFTPGTNFGAWACTIAFNRVRAWRKKQAREKLVFSDTFIQEISDELIENSDQYKERFDALESCVSKLPEHHRELLRQRYTAELTIDSIADRVGRTNDAVYRMLSRIRHVLHDCVSQTLRTQETS